MPDYFNYELIYNINADGTYNVEIDEKSLDNAIYDYNQKLKKNLPYIYGDMVAELYMTEDMLAQECGYENIDEMVDATIEESFVFDEMKATPHNSECGIAPSDFSSDSTKRPQAG